LPSSNYFTIATIAINASGINSELAEPAASSIVDATTGASMTGSLIPLAKAVVAAAAKTVAKISFFMFFSIYFGSHESHSGT
jgi:hypothetical protein